MKNIFFLLILMLLFSCIKAFDPKIKSNAERKYVVSGRITDTEGWQEVEVSLSSPIESPEFIPVGGCKVKILDDNGHEFVLEEWAHGIYKVWIEQEYLVKGTAYQVRVNSPDGEELVSGFDTMTSGPQMDSVYYFIEEKPTSNPSVYSTGMQFYIDLNAVGDYSRFYKWEVVETWEYTAALPAEYYYDGSMHEIKPPDCTNFYCWYTGLYKNVFTVSTKNLSQNIYRQYPLQFIDGRTSRLSILYSILVRQLALSEGAYNYWEQLRINSNEQGGLYEKQPLAIKGNIVNESNPEKDVLGYFYAASESHKRYFYHDVEGVDFGFSNFCSPYELGMFGWREIEKWEYPVYFYYNEEGALRLLNRECVDCRKLGGITIKPDFWPY